MRSPIGAVDEVGRRQRSLTRRMDVRQITTFPLQYAVADESCGIPRRLMKTLDSIRGKMLMFAVLATLLPSLTTVYISYIENKRALTAKASEELLGVSAQAVREVDLWLKELRYDLLVFSSSYLVTENLERIPLVKGEPIHSGIYFKRLTDYLNSVRDRFPDYAELLVLDRHGHVVATSAAQPRPVPLAPDWASELTRNDWAPGTPYWDSAGAHAEMFVSVPIESARGA